MFFGRLPARQPLQKMNFDFKRPMRADRVAYAKYIHKTGH